MLMEKVIHDYLCEELSEDLTNYLNIPAVFNISAPSDEDEEWGENTQYPRAIFELNMQDDPERKVSGQLFIDVLTENDDENAEGSVTPEELEVKVKSAVDGCFFSTNSMTISAKWSRSDSFVNTVDDKVVGITIIFDVMAYPIQETTDPDPVKAVNLWIKTLYPNAKVIGRDTLSETWTPTDSAPAFYCRVARISNGSIPSTYAVEWLGVDMRINVMAPSPEVRLQIIKQSTEILKAATRIMLDDGSPMMIDSITDTPGADYLKEGQIQINATYGVLRTMTGTPIQHIHVRNETFSKEV